MLAQTDLLIPSIPDAAWNLAAVLVWLGLIGLLLVGALLLGRVRRGRTARAERRSNPPV